MTDSSKTFLAALVGALSGSAVAAIITGLFTTNIEKQKFEYSLLTESLKLESPIDRLERLHFLYDSSFIETAELKTRISRLIAAAESSNQPVPQLPGGDVISDIVTTKPEFDAPWDDWFAVMTSYSDKQLSMAQQDKARFNEILSKEHPDITASIYKTKISNSYAVVIGGPVDRKRANDLTALGKKLHLSKTAFPQRDRDWSLQD
jgi:hypothetical protein